MKSTFNIHFLFFFTQDAGIWYVFHNASTGDSHGMISETKAELTPLGTFFNNRVHSNFKVIKYFIYESYIKLTGWCAKPTLK